MKFEAIPRETVLLDPNDNMARKNIPNEIRKDPLTGKTSRICHFRELRWEKPDIEKLIAGTENWCPFCPEKVLKVTPCFAPEIVPEGRMTLDEAGQLDINLNNAQVPINDFVNRIMASTLKAMLANLKGVGEIKTLELNIKK